MGKNLQFHLVAEGIENQDQVDFLNMYGCDYGQGYFYSPPVSSEEFDKLLKERCRDGSLVHVADKDHSANAYFWRNGVHFLVRRNIIK